MKILHYLLGLPPARTGGLPQYALDLMHAQQDLGHEICMLIPGNIKLKSSSKVYIRKWKEYNGILCYQLQNPIYVTDGSGISQPAIFMPAVDQKIYIQWLIKCRPDVIHIHSLAGIHREFFEAAKQLQIRMVFTTHDYFGLCPKTNLLKDMRNCNTNDWADCIACCKNATSLRRLRLDQSNMYRKYCESKYLMRLVHSEKIVGLKQALKRMLCVKNGAALEQEKDACDAAGNAVNYRDLEEQYHLLQQYYLGIFQLIDCFHFNSNQTRQVFERVLGKKTGKVIPVINSSVGEHRRKRKFENLLKIGYLGAAASMKGYGYLLQECQRLYDSGRTEFYLNTYFWELQEKRLYIHNHRPFTPAQQEQIYGDMDVLVVPSLCRETFGMVAIEALSYGVPVIMSNNVGAKMIVEKYEGCSEVFSPQDGELYQILKGIYDDRSTLERMNEAILAQDMEELDYKKHVKEILELYTMSAMVD